MHNTQEMSYSIPTPQRCYTQLQLHTSKQRSTSQNFWLKYTQRCWLFSVAVALPSMYKSNQQIYFSNHTRMSLKNPHNVRYAWWPLQI